MKKRLIFIYGLICYLIFLITFLYAIGFVGNFFVPKSIDQGNRTVISLSAIISNMVLLSVFALQHSVMARPAFKKRWTTIIAPQMERSTYVLLASLCLLLLFWQWQSLGGTVWEIKQPAVKYAFTVFYFLGWAIVLAATFMINHFDLFGLKQVFYYFKNKTAGDPEFKTAWMYRIVRHPIMLGFLIAFWATPVMTVGHLVFTLITTAYILIAIKFLEERDLQKSIGQPYTEYKKKVPMLLPFTK